jgi:hypothetical protein
MLTKKSIIKKFSSFIFVILFPLFVKGQNTVCFTIEDNPNPNDPALGVFTKYVRVLDCIDIYAESNITDEKVLHVAAVAAELLDNDEDGVVDDPLIQSSLAGLNTVLPIFNSENGSAIDLFSDNFDDCAGAVLFRNEIDPSEPGHWGSDATVEEVLHTINTCGHVEVYPDLYGLTPNSSDLTHAMDVARGGQFTSIPNPYPNEAWYHYDDNSCEYDCMAMEYLYWCIVTNMGILADAQTCNGIANEWEPCTPALFESTDTLMFNLVTNPDNILPQLAPDGNYCPSQVGLGNELPYGFSLLTVYPNPFNPTTTIRFDIPVKTVQATSLHIFDINGRLVETLFKEITEPGHHEIQWNASNHPSGIYFLQLNSGRDNAFQKIVLVK